MAHGGRVAGPTTSRLVETTLMQQGHVRDGGGWWGMGRGKMIRQGLGVVVVGGNNRTLFHSKS